MPNVARRMGTGVKHYSKSYWILNFSDVGFAVMVREKSTGDFKLMVKPVA